MAPTIKEMKVFVVSPIFFFAFVFSINLSLQIFFQGFPPCGHIVNINDTQDKVVQHSIAGRAAVGISAASAGCSFGFRRLKQGIYEVFTFPANPCAADGKVFVGKFLHIIFPGSFGTAVYGQGMVSSNSV